MIHFKIPKREKKKKKYECKLFDQIAIFVSRITIFAYRYSADAVAVFTCTTGFRTMPLGELIDLNDRVISRKA